MIIPLLRPTFAEINVHALKNNILKAKALIAKRGAGNPKILLLVKANAYGHDAGLISKYVQDNKLVDFLGVASIEEGMELRQKNITLPILVLGSIWPFECFEYAIKNKLSVTVASVRAAKFLAELSAKLKMKAYAHVKQETGMNRIGSRRPAALEMLKTLNESPYVEVQGTFSHFACADNEDYSQKQFTYFNELLSDAKTQNLNVGLRHLSASLAFLKYPQAQFDMVRLGHLAYGLEDGFEPVLSLKSKIVFIKDVRADVPIGYGGTFVTKRPSKIATVPIGYGDGYPRSLSNKTDVEILGKRCPQIGNITMDMMMVDITELGDIKVGTEVTLIGKNLPALELAKKCGTIDYEILTILSKRFPRLEV